MAGMHLGHVAAIGLVSGGGASTQRSKRCRSDVKATAPAEQERPMCRSLQARILSRGAKLVYWTEGQQCDITSAVSVSAGGAQAGRAPSYRLERLPIVSRKKRCDPLGRTVSFADRENCNYDRHAHKSSRYAPEKTP